MQRRTAPRVLGVDPGLARCGLAVVDGPRHRPVLRRVGVVRTDGGDTVGDRLRQLGAALRRLIADERPQVVAVERVLFNANATTAIGVAQAAGVALLAAAEAGCEAVEYTPSQVKATVAGSGDADKRQVGAMVAATLGLSQPPRPADAADALALALCHLQRGGFASAPTEAVARSRLAEAAAAAGPGAPVVAPRRGARVAPVGRPPEQAPAAEPDRPRDREPTADPAANPTRSPAR